MGIRKTAGIGLALLSVVLLTGCGTLKTDKSKTAAETSSGRVQETYVSPALPLLEEIRLGITDQEQGEWSVYELASGEMIYGTESKTYLEKIDGSMETEELAPVLSAMGIAPGDESSLFTSCDALKTDYALVDYEFADRSEESVYEGNLELDQEELEQCMITFAWFEEDGEWQALNYRTDAVENHEDLVTLIFAIQGPAGNCGVQNGQICGIFAEYYGE